ncbi:MAG: ThuA domain-containing protein [Planctomycetota bacterium]|nr:ThuA domain-containing protein [Planctomycetota bacterium]
MLLKLLCVLVVLSVAASAPTASAEDKKLVLIAGKPSHGPGDHEFRAGCLLLKKCLDKFPGLQVVVESNGWVSDPKVFDGAAAVVLYSDGAGGNPFIQGDHAKVIGELAKKGVGVGMMHFAVEVPKDNGGPQFLEWTGGYYEDRFSCNPMWSPDYQTFPQHPITRGVKPFSCNDEWYMHIRFRPDMKGVTPILIAKPSDKVRDGPYVWPKGPYPHIQADKGKDEYMMWCVEREDGGRGFGWTGGHYHKNWLNDNYRKTVLNALAWVCKLEVPAQGVDSTVTEADLKENLDKKK